MAIGFPEYTCDSKGAVSNWTVKGTNQINQVKETRSYLSCPFLVKRLISMFIKLRWKKIFEVVYLYLKKEDLDLVLMNIDTIDYWI